VLGMLIARSNRKTIKNMVTEKFSSSRIKKQSNPEFDFVIVGGGMAGVCAAIGAAEKE